MVSLMELNMEVSILGRYTLVHSFCSFSLFFVGPKESKYVFSPSQWKSARDETLRPARRER